MGFYELNKEQRALLVLQIHNNIFADLNAKVYHNVFKYAQDPDTYIRKASYQALGKIYIAQSTLHANLLLLLELMIQQDDFKIRQTAINAAGEIGKKDFDIVQHFFDKGLFDANPAVRNAVIGSVKKMGAVNPAPVLRWAKNYLTHNDKEIRREICHGIELRGRTHPQDILPLLERLQHDPMARVRNTLVHVLGQIAYKKGCLATVVQTLKTWDNRALIAQALEEIIDVHYRYRNFAVLTQEQAKEYISKEFGV